jgi:HAD superfamily hydrolase (TIGR01509 family)
METAVLLDVDGTLLDSNDAHARAWADVGAEFGHPIRFEAARPLIGMGGDKVLPRLTGLEESSEEGERIVARRGELFRSRYGPRLQPFRGTRELVERMQGDGLRLVVATSASGDDLQLLLERAGIADLIDAAADADDADASKPAPDIVEAALEKAGVPASQAVMLGDTPYDVAACRRAGVAIIAFRCGGWADADLEGAAEIYDGPADLLVSYESSLLGRVVHRR